MNIITNGNKQTNKQKHNKSEYVQLHLHIHVRYIRQPQSRSEILYIIFKLTYAHTERLNFMELHKLLEIGIP